MAAPAKVFGRSLRDAALLVGVGMGSALLPAFAYFNGDAIRQFLPDISALAEVFGAGSDQPRLVTFGPSALISEGDHDHRQLVRIEVPGGAGEVGIRVFDADSGGNHDETMGASDTTTRFSLFGEGAKGRLTRTAGGVVEETVEGTPIFTREFGLDAEADDHWTTLFSVDAAKGAAVEGGRRSFLLLVEGVSGNDGNVFDVAVSAVDKPDKLLDGARLSSFVLTFQVPHGGRFAELGFDIPDGATELVAENFDAAGGSILFAGRFRSQGLTPSGKSDWRRDTIALESTEPGERASLTAANGGETPNDMTLFLSARKAGAESNGEPVAFDLPINVLAPSRRPAISLTAIPKACGVMRFDASGSSDPEGGPLTHRWRFDNDGSWLEGATVEQRFATFGLHKARLESFNGSGLIGNGRARDIAFLVKEPPVARFEAPPLVAEGAELTLDASASTALALPEGNRIAAYRWSLGDGTEVVQRAGGQQFGRLAYRYARHGVYTVRLTLLDSADNPCNSATTTQTVTVNAAPVANAGGDRSLALGQALDVNAGPATDADNDALRFHWDFGDGAVASTATATHIFANPGTYSLTLTVDDGKGATNSITTARASVFVNASPIEGSLKVPDRMVAGMPGVFDASDAVDPDGKIVQTQWSFGDGTTSDRTMARHAFAKEGSYSVTVKLTDNSGLANATTVITRSVTVVPAGNTQPVADAGGNRDAVVDAVVEFDGSKSKDSDGSILSYHWDFGDGTKGEGLATRHTYRTAGTYHATLTIKDDSGKENDTATATVEMVVANRGNASPAARVGGDRSAYVGEIVDFDATGTTDSDGSIVAVEWDFGDGARASGFTAKHAYGAPGEYKAHVLVRDDSSRRGATSEAAFTVSVTHAPNRQPTVSMPSELTLQAGVEAAFDASSATDAGGLITRYRWDFGDGSGTDEPKIGHTYARPGTYFGSLTLVDNSGLESGTVVQKFVAFVDERSNAAPVADAGADIAAIVGQRVDFDGGRSSDSDGSLIGYRWDFGNGKSAEGEKRSIAYTAPGNYTVTLTVTDNSGQANATAKDTLIVTVADRPNVAPLASVEPDRPAAIDEPIRFSGAASKDADGNILSYDWDFGDGATASGRDVVHRYAKSGAYVARLTVTDDSGLANNQSFAQRRIKVNEPPVAIAGQDQYLTASVVDFDASQSSDLDGKIASYEWDFGDGETGSGAKTSHTYSSVGAYLVKLKIADDSGTIRNTADDSLTVRINAAPIADAGFGFVVAPGEPAKFDGRRSTDPDGSIKSYKWDFRDGSTATGDVVEHAFAKPGRYTVDMTVVDDSGHSEATDFAQIVVAVNAPPLADAGADLSVGPGDRFTLSGRGSSDTDGAITSWRWDIHGSDKVLEGAQPEFSFDQPGVYSATLTVTDDSSARNRTAQDEVTIAVNHPPVAEAGTDIFSDVLRVVLEGSSSADADSDGLTYRWDFGDGSFGEGAVTEHTYPTGGVYPVVLTVDDGRGMKNSRDDDAIRVRINRPPAAQAGKDVQACIGDLVVFDGSSSTDPDKSLLRYAWKFGDGEGSGIVNPTKTYSAPGTYRVALQVTDESGLANARSSDEALVSVLPAPVARAGDDLKVCANTAVQFDGSKSTDLDGVVNRFSWDFGDGQAGGGDKPNHTYLDPGTYRVTLQVEGDNLGMCSPVATDELTVSVIDAPKPSIKAQRAAAVGEQVSFDSSGSSIGNRTPLSYAWDFGDGTTGTGVVASHAYAQPGIYRVQMHATALASQGGCASTKAVHVITVNAAPIANAGSDRSVEVNQSLTLSGADSSDPDGGIADYKWDFGDGVTATGVEVRHVWRKPGKFAVALRVSDGTGLANGVSEKSIWVNVADAPQIQIAAPSVACVAQPTDFGLQNLATGFYAAAIKWRFGDGSEGNGATASHAFARPGKYTVGVSGPLDRAGQVEMTPIAKVITINEPPVAVIDVDRKTCAAAEVRFDASRSFDPEGAPISFEWDFGDGSAAKGAKVTHRFENPGTYPVRLTVLDGSGSMCASGATTLDMFVNAPPVADAGPDSQTFIGGAQDSYVLDASGSRDPDGDPLSYHWALSNGMKFDGERARVVFDEPGPVTATLTTTDPHGLVCGTSSDILRIDAKLRPKQKPVTD